MLPAQQHFHANNNAAAQLHNRLKYQTKFPPLEREMQIRLKMYQTGCVAVQSEAKHDWLRTLLRLGRRQRDSGLTHHIRGAPQSALHTGNSGTCGEDEKTFAHLERRTQRILK